MKRKDKTDQMTEGKVWKQLLYFFFPLMFGMFFQQLYAMADSMIVGHFLGKQALAAVGGTAASFVNLIVGFFTGLSAGATVIISQLIGKQASAKIKIGVCTSVVIGTVGGLLFMLAGLWISDPILKVMMTPPDIFEDSLNYLRIYLLGIIPSLVYNIGAGVLRAAGDVRRPLYYLIFSCIINIVLDYLFVAVMPFGIAGAGAATVLAQWVSALCICAALFDKKKIYGIDFRHFCPERNMLFKILNIGIPAGLQSIMYNAANMIVQASINSLGTDTVAAWTIYNKADGIFGMVVLSFGTAAMTFTGQNYGAHKYERIRRGVRDCLLMCGAATLVLSAGLMCGAEYFYRLFTEDTAVIQIGKLMIYFLAPFQIIYIFAEILSGVVRGVGKSLMPMMITLGSVCILRIVWLIFAVPLWKNILAVLFCFPLTWFVSSAIFIIYGFKKLPGKNSR